MFITVPSGTQWFVILLLILVVVGYRRFPDIARSVGESIRGFKEGYRGDDDPPASNGGSGPA